ncbi:MarR family transcriptional regulator [Streptomyces paradoxus]|jgi:DNA-binding MarR family transcriptional regulator|uniref:DNA-binding MarR family transcriptional regulator n=1 Tax=Streptomyces paradoxus TaxID=66375 RepID=A0A7W9TE80_9ACTN|nr:MarR family transcriptional regulator [Streptomyces paradoxus]MBB6078421.1 DNA-binding MarR family transcriptional regulator [Streptomyces paradoxus]
MPPTPSKAQLMELLAHSVSTHYADFTTAAADTGLTSSQAKTLTVLRRAPASMRSLAHTLACDASNMTGIIDRLEKRDLVRREVSATDRRVKNVALTEAGQKLIDAIRERMEQTQTGLDQLSDEERAELFRLLTVVFPAQ